MGNSKSKIIIILTIVFAILGTICCVIGYFNSILSWLKNFGLAFLIMSAPLLLTLIYNIVIKKIRDI